MLEENSDYYISEIFSSFQGEGGTVRGSCFGKRQIFVRFSGCNLAEGIFGTGGCFWCDSLNAQKLKVKVCKYEEIPGSQELSSINNPLSPKQVISIIKNLLTTDLHSISFTGGEPLSHFDQVIKLAQLLKKENIKIPLYLETNGSISLETEQFEQLAKLFKYSCCDIKDKSSEAASPEQWEDLIKRELNFIENMVKNDVETFAKIVITSQTTLHEIKWICEQFRKIKYSDGQIAGLAIQPVSLEKQELKEKYTISNKHLNEIFKMASEFLPIESLSLSIQAHKHLKLL